MLTLKRRAQKFPEGEILYYLQRSDNCITDFLSTITKQKTPLKELLKDVIH